MKAKFILIVIFLGLWSAPLALAQQTALVSLLDFATSVRATGMGGAFAGLADDEQALLYNPAGLALLEQLHGSAMLESRLSSSTVGALMGALPAFGVGLQFYGVDGLLQRDEQDQAGEAFAYGQFALLGAGAIRLGSFIGVPFLRTLGIGLRVKFLSVNTLANGSGSTFTLDPSVLWEIGDLRLGPLSLQALRVGFALDNLGPEMTYGSGYKESLTSSVRLGGSVVLQRLITASLEFNSSDGFHLGGEYTLPINTIGTLALRAGFYTGNGFTFSLGLGFTYQQLLRVDYAFSSHAQLGGSHQLAVTVSYDVGRLF